MLAASCYKVISHRLTFMCKMTVDGLSEEKLKSGYNCVQHKTRRKFQEKNKQPSLLVGNNYKRLNKSLQNVI